MSVGAIIVALSLAQGADLASTELVLSRQGHELNPLMRDRPTRIAISAATVSVETWGVHKLQKEHPKAAKAALVVLLVAKGWIVARHVREARRAR